ncbi:MAG: DUF6504 family protein [Anaerosomatales bacterium]
MGHNAAIKEHRALPEGLPLDLFDSAEGRRPIVLDLLSTPWLVRASELRLPGDGGLGRRIGEAVAVSWDAARRSPVAFAWRGRVYDVTSVVQTWAVEHAWWDAGQRVSRRCWRVLAGDGGTYDLAFERLTGAWVLLGMQD